MKFIDNKFRFIFDVPTNVISVGAQKKKSRFSLITLLHFIHLEVEISIKSGTIIAS